MTSPADYVAVDLAMALLHAMRELRALGYTCGDPDCPDCDAGKEREVFADLAADVWRTLGEVQP